MFVVTPSIAIINPNITFPFLASDEKNERNSIATPDRHIAAPTHKFAVYSTYPYAVYLAHRFLQDPKSERCFIFYSPSLCCDKLEPLAAPKNSRSMEPKYE